MSLRDSLTALGREAAANSWATRYERVRGTTTARIKQLRQQLAAAPSSKRPIWDRLRSVIGRVTRHRRTALSEELRGLSAIDNLERRQFLVLSATPGDNRISEVIGNIRTSRAVVVHVPGINTDIVDYATGHDDAVALHDALGYLVAHQVAVVSFADYNVPDDLVEASKAGGAADGAPKLLNLVDGLYGIGFGAASISIVAHSYGSLVVGYAMRLGLEVSRVVVVGSPGMSAQNRAELDSPYVELWAAQAPPHFRIGTGTIGDAAAYAPVHGTNPAKAGFGALPFGVPDAYGHSEYFVPGSMSLNAIASVALGIRP